MSAKVKVTGVALRQVGDGAGRVAVGRRSVYSRLPGRRRAPGGSCGRRRVQHPPGDRRERWRIGFDAGRVDGPAARGAPAGRTFQQPAAGSQRYSSSFNPSRRVNSRSQERSHWFNSNSAADAIAQIHSRARRRRASARRNAGSEIPGHDARTTPTGWRATHLPRVRVTQDWT